MGTQWMAEVLRKKDTKTNTAYLTERDSDLTWKEIFVKQELTRVVVQKCRFCVRRHLYQLRTEPVSLKATKADWDGKMMECTVCSIPFPSHDSSQPKSQAPSIIWITRETSHINTEKKGKYRLMDKCLRLRQKSCACYTHFDKTRGWIEGETSISRPDFFIYLTLFFSASGLDFGEMLCIVDESITPFFIAVAWDYGGSLPLTGEKV